MLKYGQKSTPHTWLIAESEGTMLEVLQSELCVVCTLPTERCVFCSKAVREERDPRRTQDHGEMFLSVKSTQNP